MTNGLIEHFREGLDIGAFDAGSEYPGWVQVREEDFRALLDLAEIACGDVMRCGRNREWCRAAQCPCGQKPARE